MTAEQQDQIRDLFGRAIDLGERADLDAWFSAEGVHDRVVCDEVRSLLEAHDRAGQFLSEPLSDRVRDDEPLPAGTTVGSYTIVRELGRGGMGRVYLASDTALGRRVALKALAPHLVHDASQRERVRREARAAAALAHPGICTVYALEEIDGELYIVSEFVDGVTLGEDLRSGKRASPNDVHSTARQLAEALACAHAAGIVHRDLKPDNVMRTRDGRVKILDFGLARVDRSVAGGDHSSAPSAQPLSAAGHLIGTPAYMAPEQLGGVAADARSDVFAWGVVIYELAAGRHPFEGATPMAMMARILESDARPLGLVVPDLPASVAAVVGRSLRKDPAARFPDASGLVSALAGTREVSWWDQIGWWRIHQAAIVGLYVLAAAVGWQIKDLQESSLRIAVFMALGAAAMVGGVLRGHLVFTSRLNRAHLAEERRATAAARRSVDVLVGGLLATDAMALASTHALAAMFTLALGLGLALASLVLEPATTRAVFGADV